MTLAHESLALLPRHDSDETPLVQRQRWLQWIGISGTTVFALLAGLILGLTQDQGATTGQLLAGADAWMVLATTFTLPEDAPSSATVAFISNSISYFNDLPRFMTALSEGSIVQDSCFHGDASLDSMLATGNGMYQIWQTENASVEDYNKNESILYDFGACTIQQLLLGSDPRLASDSSNVSLPVNDGLNPCLQDDAYRRYRESLYQDQDPPAWDFVFLSDLTRNPGRHDTRQQGLTVLQESYVPWFQQTKSIPILLDTHAYWNTGFDLADFGDVPGFTSFTYEGYKEYAQLLADALPAIQKPRIVLSGIAFLTVWEEDYDFWRNKLFHSDNLHPSPSGTFLLGCCLHYALFGRMPDPAVALRKDMSSLWATARRMQPADDPPNPFPTMKEAAYLYEVADRVTRLGYVPRSFVAFHHGEAASGP